MSEALRPWAVAEELTVEAYQQRVADGAVDVYADTNSEKYFRVFNFNEGTTPAPDSTKFKDRHLIVLTDPELVLKMATHFRMRFTETAAAA